MQASTVSAAESSTGSKTMADLAALAAGQHGDKIAQRYKADGAWQDVTYREMGEAISEIGRGLLELGVGPGDRVCILCNTRPEWTWVDLAIASAGGVVVPIYPTNSPEECEWVVGNSEARAIFVEDDAQAAKIRAVRDRLPALEQVIVIAGESEGATTLDALRESGRSVDASRLDERAQAVKPDDPFTFIYTSGTTGPPKGCVLSHGNYRSVVDMCEAAGQVVEGEIVYLYLPLAHSFALLVQLVTIDLGGTLAYYGGDTKQIIPELMEVKPTYVPSVPRIFEKLYTKAQELLPPPVIEGIKQVGTPIMDARAQGKEPPAELLEKWSSHLPGDEQQRTLEGMAGFVKNLFGGNMRQAVTGAAPIAREILEFFWACGVPVLEGFGMTETSTVATTSTIEEHKFGTVGRPLPGVEVRIADDGEILIKGANVFQGYYKNDDASFGAIEDGWLHTGDLGSLDEDGYLSITGRKKDIIITAGGKNLTPANIENDLKQSRWISQAVMHGDRRPFPVVLVTLDPEEIVAFADEHGLSHDPAELAQDPKVHELVQGILDEVNQKYAQVEQVKKFVILDHDLSQETGELTPTLKVKRNVVNEKYADLFDALYA